MRRTTDNTNMRGVQDAAPPLPGCPEGVPLRCLTLVAVSVVGVLSPITQGDCPTPQPGDVEAISRAFTVINRTESIPMFGEAISRSFTVINRTGSIQVFDEAISRAFTACNAAGSGDHDGDGDIDWDDFTEFGNCFTGPDGGTPEPECEVQCEVFDFDCDVDIDCDDYQEFVAAWTEGGEPPYFKTCDASIPAVSEWGLVVMTLLVLAAGTLLLRRRRVVRP